MKKILHTLIELQDIDTQLAEIEAHKGNLPQKVQELEQTGAEIRERLEAAKAKAKSDEKELQQLDGALSDSKTTLAKYQDQLYLVTTNREYDALTNEIDTVKTKVLDVQSQQSVLRDEIEKLTEEITDLTAKESEVTENLEKRKDELTSKTDQTNNQQNELEGRREVLAKDLGQRYLRKYERILKVRGQAVVPVKRRACGGCHKQISDQLLYEIKGGEKFIECEGCGRILVYIPDEEN